MTTQTEAELAEFARNADDLRGRLGQLGRFIGGNTGTGGSARIIIQAGPVASWLAAGISLCGAAFVAGALLVGAAWYAEQSQQTRDEIADLRQRDRVHDAYINASFRDKKPETK